MKQFMELSELLARLKQELGTRSSEKATWTLWSRINQGVGVVDQGIPKPTSMWFRLKWTKTGGSLCGKFQQRQGSQGHQCKEFWERIWGFILSVPNSCREYSQMNRNNSDCRSVSNTWISSTRRALDSCRGSWLVMKVPCQHLPQKPRFAQPNGFQGMRGIQEKHCVPGPGDPQWSQPSLTVMVSSTQSLCHKVKLWQQMPTAPPWGVSESRYAISDHTFGSRMETGGTISFIMITQCPIPLFPPWQCLERLELTCWPTPLIVQTSRPMIISFILSWKGTWGAWCIGQCRRCSRQPSEYSIRSHKTSLRMLSRIFQSAGPNVLRQEAIFLKEMALRFQISWWKCQDLKNPVMKNSDCLPSQIAIHKFPACFCVRFTVYSLVSILVGMLVWFIGMFSSSIKSWQHQKKTASFFTGAQSVYFETILVLRVHDDRISKLHSWDWCTTAPIGETSMTQRLIQRWEWPCEKKVQGRSDCTEPQPQPSCSS